MLQLARIVLFDNEDNLDRRLAEYLLRVVADVKDGVSRA